MSESQPFQVGIAFNKATSRWDLQIVIGDFKSKAEAEAAAKAAAELLAWAGGYVNARAPD